MIAKKYALGDIDRIDGLTLSEQERQRLNRYAWAHQTYTFADVDDQGEVVVYGIAGLAEYHPGRAEVWAVIGDAGRALGMVVSRVAQTTIAAFQAQYHRLEALVPTGYNVNRRFIEHLGFSEEGTMVGAWFDGTDAVMYGRVRHAE